MEIDWEEFFLPFEDEGLEMLYQHDPTNTVSRSYEFVPRHAAPGPQESGHAVSAEETPPSEVPRSGHQPNVRG